MGFPFIMYFPFLGGMLLWREADTPWDDRTRHCKTQYRECNKQCPHCTNTSYGCLPLFVGALLVWICLQIGLLPIIEALLLWICLANAYWYEFTQITTNQAPTSKGKSPYSYWNTNLWNKATPWFPPSPNTEMKRKEGAAIPARCSVGAFYSITGQEKGNRKRDQTMKSPKSHV